MASGVPARTEPCMSSQAFHFVHASDLHLELPAHGIAEVPEHLRELLLECGYWAAERVVEAVLAEGAAFLVLSGDVLDPVQTGPRGPLFLAEQFGRLAERGVPVYWAGGAVDPPDAWPAAVRLPDNVHVFPPGRPSRLVFQREGVATATLIGASRHQEASVRLEDFASDPQGLFTVAVLHGVSETDGVLGRGIHYWALGGHHARHTPRSSPPVVDDPGTPQGREPSQIGPHGCSLVRVDAQKQIQITFLPTDLMRWYSERILIEPTTTRQELESLLEERVGALKQANAGTDLFVSWRVAGTGRLAMQLRRGTLASELLDALRRDHGFASPAVWSVELSVEPMAVLPAAWFQEETILGDFLRELRSYQEHPEQPIVLDSYLAEAHRSGPLGACAAIAPGPDRERLLREAAMLGADLLSGEGTEP